MDTDNQTRNGIFSLSSTGEVNGTLSLNGDKSILHIWTNSLVDLEFGNLELITGTLDNQQKVSLIDCIHVGGNKIYGKGGYSQHYRLFPHYVVIGHRHFSKFDKGISKISLIIDDAEILFDDRISFGSMIIPSDRINEIAHLDLFGEIPFEGDNSILAYWTGKTEIFESNTKIGRIYARHQPGFGTGGPGGVYIKNKISVMVEFSKPASVSDLSVEIPNLLNFFQVIIGRAQNLLSIKIIETDTAYPESSSIHFSMRPNYPRESDGWKPSSQDILIDAASKSREFSNVLREWLNRDKGWRAARTRFAVGWNSQKTYNVDRIVRAANMFDLLPYEELQKNSHLDQHLKEAVEASIFALKRLPHSKKRNEILGYLGRVNVSSLKEKVRSRALVVSDRIAGAVPNIESIVDAAVDLRNIYVHGPPSGSGGRKKLHHLEISMSFLTDTLEFVFCASDLIECGWNIESWNSKPKALSHPFSEYLYSYSENAKKLLE